VPCTEDFKVDESEELAGGLISEICAFFWLLSIFLCRLSKLSVGEEALSLFKLTSTEEFLMTFLGSFSNTILIFSLSSTAFDFLEAVSEIAAGAIFCLIFTTSFSPSSSRARVSSDAESIF
jgi:hypothetical protein